MRAAPKDGTRFLMLHDGYPGLCVHIAQWMDKVIPDWLFKNAGQKVAHLPGKNPFCQGRWVAEACEPLKWSNGLEGDERYVVKPYVWDPVRKPLGWMPLPKATRRKAAKR